MIYKAFRVIYVRTERHRRPSENHINGGTYHESKL
nr:MAG TPA: hypothetical protein [Caudoviricetes sp.]